MLEHAKGKEPPCLTTYRATPGAGWGSVRGADKQQVREAVCRDQGCLCVYCQRRIRPQEGSTFIEHWNPQSTGEEVLAWRNLLGVCSGSTGGEHHCDKARPPGSLLFLQPVEGLGPSPRKFLKYLAGGRLEAHAEAPAEVRRDIDVHLNLNAFNLQRARREVYDLLRQVLGKDFSVRALREELRRHTASPGGELPEQAGMVRYQLERWLKKKQAARS